MGLPRSTAIPVAFPFQYKDGWFFSGGAEYKWTDRLTVRGGIGYEISPVVDQVRMPLVPDNDRFWASVGATWQVFKGLHFDLAYSHIWVKDPSINISAGSGNPWFIPGATAPYVGSANAHVDILSGALVFRWDEPAAAPANRADHEIICEDGGAQGRHRCRPLHFQSAPLNVPPSIRRFWPVM